MEQTNIVYFLFTFCCLQRIHLNSQQDKGDAGTAKWPGLQYEAEEGDCPA